MTPGEESNGGLSALVLAAVLVASLVTAGVTLTGSAAAANEPTLTINSVTPDPAIVDSGDNVTVNYTATDVNSPELVFLNDSGVVRTVSIATGSDKPKTVSAPASNGTYKVQLVSDSEESDTTQLVVDTEAPGVSLVSPADGTEARSHPTLAANAVDNVAVATVEFRVKRNSEYWNGSDWVSSETWVTATYQQDSDTWNVTNEPDEDGSYTAIARATDEAGHRTKSNRDSSIELPGNGEVSYTVDSTKPVFDNVSVEVTGGDRTVVVGDEVTVTANVTDATSGVESVTVDASALGKSETLSLTNGDGTGPVWNRTFTVSDVTVPDGSHTLTVTATDGVGLSETKESGSVTLDTAAANVGDITIDADFLGVVEDTEIRVTATNVTDDNGNPIDVGTVNVSIAGTTPFDPVNVTDGTVNTTIDPTKLANNLQLGEPVEVDIAGTGATSDTVKLAHEVRTLEKGWHVGGTPMPATDVLLSGDGTIMTYNKSAAGNWSRVTNPETFLARPGAGYYFNITSERARVGYIFDQSSDKYAWTLTEGVNLIGAVAAIDQGKNATLGSVNTTLGDLKGYVANGDATLVYHVRNSTDDTPLDDLVGTKEVSSNSVEVLAYSSYVIEVETPGDKPVTYTVGLEGYDPEEKPN